MKRLEDWPDVLKEGEVGSESLSSSSISLGSIQGVFQKCIFSSFETLKEKTNFLPTINAKLIFQLAKLHFKYQ